MSKMLKLDLTIDDKEFIIEVSKFQGNYLITDNSFMLKSSGILYNGKDINYFILYNIFLTFMKKRETKELMYIEVKTKLLNIKTTSPEVVADFIAKFILECFEEEIRNEKRD